MLKEITRKVLKYSDIPNDVKNDSPLEDSICESYILFELRDKGLYKVDDWIRENYPELEGEEFLIHIDC